MLGFISEKIVKKKMLLSNYSFILCFGYYILWTLQKYLRLKHFFTCVCHYTCIDTISIKL